MLYIKIRGSIDRFSVGLFTYLHFLKGGQTMLNRMLTLDLRGASERYGLSKPTLCRIAREHGALLRPQNKYLVKVDIMDCIILGSQTAGGQEELCMKHSGLSYLR